MPKFEHKAMKLQDDKSLVYTAISKHYFYYRMFISKYVIEQHKVPLNPFMIFDYFLLDTVDRDLIREGNNNLIKRCDELWVFGPISNGVLAEIKIAQKMSKEIKYFKIVKPHKIVPIAKQEVEMEEDVKDFKSEL
jgi:fructose-bisphosphate aldolase class 1